MPRRTFAHALGPAAALALAAVSPAAIIGGPYNNPANGHSYYLASIDSYADFAIQAALQGGYPVIVNNAAENEWIRTNVAADSSPLSTIFIGLSDEAEEGSFQWPAGVADAYRNWGVGEPNNSTANGSAGEDFVVFGRSSGLWNDLRNPSFFSFTVGIIEVGGGASGDPAGIFAGPIVNPANAKAYYILTPALAGNARRFAQSLGGDLVTVNDAAEQAWLTKNVAGIAGTTTSLTIGLNDTALEGTFVWYDGSPSTYRRWLAGEPNNIGGNEDNVCMTAASFGSSVGLWLDQADAPRHSIVETTYVEGCRVDFDRSGAVNIDDIFIFLNAWFAGCP